MSTPSPPAAPARPRHQYLGAQLKFALQHVRDEMLRAVHAAGFSDFEEAHFAIFSYPLPEGVRPADLARQRRMTRQAINYLIAQLEDRGYVERRAKEDGDRRLIYLSPRGWEVAEAIFACLRNLHSTLAEEVGKDRFEVFLGVLGEISRRGEQGERFERS